MNDVAETIENEESGLDDLVEEWQAEQAEAEEEANQPTKEEAEKARKLAQKMNSGFLWIVNRTQCPHVKIDQVINREEGDEAFQALAERWGGEVPEWMQRFEPYIAAGVYMGTAVVTAKQAEAQALEIIEAQKKNAEGAQHGNESEPRS